MSTLLENYEIKSRGKGLTFNDRQLAARVRTLTLQECEKALLKKKGRLYEAVLLKLAGCVLPRLNEVSGADGTPLVLNFDPRLKDVITT